MAKCQPNPAFGSLLDPEQKRYHREGLLGSRRRVLERRYSDRGQCSAGNETCGGWETPGAPGSDHVAEPRMGAVRRLELRWAAGMGETPAGAHVVGFDHNTPTPPSDGCVTTLHGGLRSMV